MNSGTESGKRGRGEEGRVFGSGHNPDCDFFIRFPEPLPCNCGFAGNVHRLIDIVLAVRLHPGWIVRLDTDGPVPFVQVAGWVNDPTSGEISTQKGRKWMLSYHMTEGEVVQTCLLAVLTAAEHEQREHFRYRGQRVFSPHLSMKDLVEGWRGGGLGDEVRKEGV